MIPLHIYVYCKNGRQSIDEKLKGQVHMLTSVEEIPNIGREGDTYLHHIVTHYDTKLDDVTVFLQGDVRDHLKGRGVTDVIPRWISEAQQIGFSRNIICCTNCGTDYDWDIQTYRDVPLEEREPLCFGQWFEKYIGLPLPDVVYWYCGAQFSVHKHLLVQRPRASYEWVRSSLHPFCNPKTGHFLERSWAYVTQIYTLLPRS